MTPGDDPARDPDLDVDLELDPDEGSASDGGRRRPGGTVAWFARNPVAANVLMLVVVLGGLVALPALRVEVFPEFSVETVNVSVVYPGASPEEVEEGICRRVEEELQGLSDVKHLRSTATEGVGAVSVEVLPGGDFERVLREVKVRVDAIDSFPLEAEPPVVTEVIARNQVINVAVAGDVDERTLRELAEEVREDLLAIDGITMVDMAAARPFEISIEVPEETLRRFDLTLSEVAQAVRRQSLDLPAGSVRTRGGEVLLRTKGQAYVGREFEDIVLRTAPDGTRLLLGDVAEVVDGFEETDQDARFDGQPGIILQVFRVGEQSALEISDAVQAYTREVQDRLPPGVAVTYWRDDARYLRGRLETLISNGITGLLLVLAVLMLFLRTRLALWVTLGIPISFLGAFAVMPALGASINVLSLFAFILVLGIVVDDAIVVGESIYRRMRAGQGGVEAAVAGARSVSVPVVFAVLTTITAFVPLATLSGFTGRIWRVVPMAVIPTLAFSLVESLWILPAHLSHLNVADDLGRGPVRWWRLFQRRFSGGLEAFAERVYQPSVDRALRLRYLTLAGAIAVMLLTGGMIGAGWLRFAFFPKLPADDISCAIAMPEGTPAFVTAQAVAQVERAAQEVVQGAGPGVVEHMLASVGEQPWRQAQTQNRGRVGGGASGAHLGEVHIALRPAEERDSELSPGELVRRWREATGDIAGAEEVAFTSELMGAGAAIDLELSHADLEVLRASAAELREVLEGYPGVFDVTDSYREGKHELRLDTTPEGEALGVDRTRLGLQVRQAFYGEEAQRVQRGRDEVRVMVRYPDRDRRALGSLEDLRVRLDDGTEVPFSTVAVAVPGRGPATIARTDRRRTVHVTGDVDGTITSANEVMASLQEPGGPLEQLLARHRGLSWEEAGEQQEQAETLSGLGRGLVIALMAIYALMAIPFRSYLQPAIVMTAIPFGMVGALLGHLLLGMTANVLSMCGMVALAGVVVNDNLVLVDTINRSRRPGVPLLDVVRRAGTIRFRPILLTSLTTFAGLTPLMLEPSLQAQFLIPMAVSLAFGVMFSTSVSLVLVPCLYLILEDLRKLVLGPGAKAEADARLGGRAEPGTEMEPGLGT